MPTSQTLQVDVRVPATAMIEARGISKAFGQTQALDQVDLVAETGRVLALLGPNGAGKTTLVRILTTLLLPDAGSARIFGLDVVKDAAAIRSLVGLSGQFAAIDDLLTGRENLEMMGRLYRLGSREARARAGALLEQFGLTDAASRLAKTYSGGMRRRLDLAASLIARPPVLILDEPTTGLDPRTRIDVWNAIDDLVSAGATVLLTTQYLEDAERLAHRIVVIDRGHVIAEGTAEELKDSVGGDLVEVRLAQSEDFSQLVESVRPIAASGLVEDRDRMRITLPAPQGAETLKAVLRRLDEAGVTVHDIGIRRPSLDDVFLTLTGHSASTDGPATPPAATTGRTRRARGSR